VTCKLGALFFYLSSVQVDSLCAPKSPASGGCKMLDGHYMKTELQTILKSYPTIINHTDIVDFDDFDERLSAVDSLVANTIGVSEDFIEFIPNNEPPLEEEIYCWIWAIRPDLSKDLLDLDVSKDFRILLKSHIDNDMARFWNHIS